MITRESEAWFRLAQKVDAMKYGEGFLCWWVESEEWSNDDERGFSESLSPEVRRSMLARIESAHTEPDWRGSGVFAQSRGGFNGRRKHSHAEHRRWRVLACLVFGWEALDREQSEEQKHAV